MKISAAAFVILGLCVVGLAQESEQDLKQEIENLKQGQQVIRRELQEIKALLKGLQPSRPSGPNVRDVEIDLRNNPIKGENSAPLTLIEFSDYQ